MLTPAPEPLTRVGDAQPAADAGHRGETSETQVYLSARVPKALRTELQLQAVREGRPVAQLVQDAVRAYLGSAENPR